MMRVVSRVERRSRIRVIQLGKKKRALREVGSRKIQKKKVSG